MSRPIITHDFNPRQPVYARKSFVANGHRFGIGDHFDWHRLAVSQRQVAKLFAAGRLRHDPKDVAADHGAPAPQYPEVGGVSGYDGPSDPGVSTDTTSSEQDTDDLDEVDKLNDLKAIAEAEGAPTNFVSKKDQREAIRAHRRGE